MAPSGTSGMERTGGGFALPPQASGPKQATHPAILQVFSPDRDKGAEKPYYEQADASMYTPQSIAARKALRQHPAVLDAIGRFAALYDADADGRITLHAYKPVHAAMAKTLIPDIGMAELADEAIKDWDDDRKEADSLDQARLADSIFEMADHWCPGLDVEEYVSFLDALGDRVRSAL